MLLFTGLNKQFLCYKKQNKTKHIRASGGVRQKTRQPGSTAEQLAIDRTKDTKPLKAQK